jgi:tetratricopeptide (TPR) repeat protein
MKLRFPTLVFAAILVVPALNQAWAQSAEEWLSPPDDVPPVERGAPTYSLDTLFSALKIAPDETSAKAIEGRIWSVWLVSGSDTCDVLMSRVKDAIDNKDYDTAIQLLDSIIAIKPNYVEAWNRRATVYYLKQDYAHSIADIAEVLVREPRHFGALSGLGLMLQEIGDDKDALDAYRKALALDPHLEGVPDIVRTLTDKVEGRNI